jgi:hypothetical protein
MNIIKIIIILILIHQAMDGVRKFNELVVIIPSSVPSRMITKILILEGSCCIAGQEIVLL